MSSEDQTVAREQYELDLHGVSTDWHLQTLVSLANSTKISFGITLFVEGAIVSGTVVDGRRYFEEFADAFSGAFPGSEETKDNIRQAFAKHAERYDIKDGEDEDDQQLDPQYIHLVDARCISPQGGRVPTGEGALWRGKINSVSGFHLGALE